MDIFRSMTMALIITALCGAPVLAQVSGGQSGYDGSLSAIEPTSEPVRMGLAGDDPSDIGRYLVAANGGVGDVRISPDGNSVAFRWSITGSPQLWVVDVRGGQPHRLTYGSGITFFAWAPDGEGILFGADNNGDEQEAYYFISADGSEERLLLPAASGGFRVFGDFVSPTEIIFASTERNNLDFDIHRADLETGESSIVQEGEYGFFARNASPDGRYVVVGEVVGEDSDNLYLLDLTSGTLEALSVPERRANHTGGGIAWFSDGSGFFLSSNMGREYAALFSYRVGGGFELIAETESDIGNVTLCGSNGRYLARTQNEGGFSRLVVLDRSSDTELDIPALPEGVYRLDCAAETADLSITVNGWNTPSSVFVWNLTDDRLGEVFKADLAGLDPNRLVRPERVSLTARDGVEIHGLLYLPDEASRSGQAAPPMVFSVHGGPTSQSRPDFDPIAQYHVDRGLAYFEPNVRGSTGYGHTYVTLDDREKRLDSVRDLVDMLDFFEHDDRVDAGRAAVIGGSYGGYAVNAVLANYPGHFIAGVSMFGVADWVTALELASPSLKASDRIEYGDIREPEWLEFYRVNSPIRQADQIDVPVLYSHGVMDPRIDIAETETMVRALRANGIEAPFVRMLDEGHGWRKLSNQLFYYRRQAQFLHEKLGLPPVGE